MPDYPTSAKEVGHNHEVEPRILGQRLKDARAMQAHWQRRAEEAESPVHRLNARDFVRLWRDQVSVIERELRRRETLNPA